MNSKHQDTHQSNNHVRPNEYSSVKEYKQCLRCLSGQPTQHALWSTLQPLTNDIWLRQMVCNEPLHGYFPQKGKHRINNFMSHSSDNWISWALLNQKVQLVCPKFSKNYFNLDVDDKLWVSKRLSGLKQKNVLWKSRWRNIWVYLI